MAPNRVSDVQVVHEDAPCAVIVSFDSNNELVAAWEVHHRVRPTDHVVSTVEFKHGVLSWFEIQWFISLEHELFH